MNLPNVLKNLAEAQNSLDYEAYAKCFTESATVYDEGKSYSGISEIQQWIKKANETYQTVMKPLEYFPDRELLKAEVSGNFPGSPIVLSYHVKLKGEMIQSLRITG